LAIHLLRESQKKTVNKKKSRELRKYGLLHGHTLTFMATTLSRTDQNDSIGIKLLRKQLSQKFKKRSQNKIFTHYLLKHESPFIKGSLFL